MDLSSALRVVSADRLSGSVIITFNDGRCGMYSPDLLYAMLASARELHESDTVELEATAGS